MPETAVRSGGGAARNRTRPAPKPEPPHERPSGSPVSLDCLPRLLGYNLRRANQCSWRSYVHHVGESRLRPGLFSMLVLIKANAGISQIEIGRHLGVDKASIVALLDRLERAALVERRRSTRDRRCQGIFLTSQGWREIESLLSSVRKAERDLAQRFSKSELAQFLEFLRRLYSV